MIDHIVVISWDMQLLQDLFYTISHTSILLSKETIMLGLMNIILIYPWKKITLQVLYSLNNILKVFFTIWPWSTWFHVNLILYPLHFVIQKHSRMKLSYLHLERKIGLKLLDDEDFTLLYVMDKIPNSPDGRQIPTQAKKICVSLLSMENIPWQIK